MFLTHLWLHDHPLPPPSTLSASHNATCAYRAALYRDMASWDKRLKRVERLLTNNKAAKEMRKCHKVMIHIVRRESVHVTVKINHDLVCKMAQVEWLTSGDITALCCLSEGLYLNKQRQVCTGHTCRPQRVLPLEPPCCFWSPTSWRVKGACSG